MSQQVCESCGTAGEFKASAPGLPLKCPFCSGTTLPQGTIFGKYKLMSEIGRGSMGIVHDAQDMTLHRRVALKIMQPRRGEAPKDAVTDWQRFIQEARLTANVAKHAGIVTIYEAAVQDSQRYIAMEFVAGEAFGRWRQGRATREQVRLLRDVALAIHHAHEHGIVHRDLKPGNILVGKGGVPVVTDFGLATYARRGVASSVTPTGFIVGSPTYMSPEQARGHREIARGTDVYSLGIMLYEAVAGRPPFAGKTPVETLSKVVEGTSVRPSQAATPPSSDSALDDIVMKAIALEPKDRHATASDLAADLTRWLGDSLPGARKVRQGRIVAAAAAGLLVVGVMVGLQSRAEHRAEERERKIQAELDDTRKKIEAMHAVPPIFVPLETFKQKVVGQFNETSSSKVSFYSAGLSEAAVTIPEAGTYEVTLNASCTEAAGEYAKLRLTVDDQMIADLMLTTTKPEDYHLTAKFPAGEHRIGIEFTNDLYIRETREDRNLFIHRLSLQKR